MPLMEDRLTYFPVFKEFYQIILVGRCHQRYNLGVPKKVKGAPRCLEQRKPEVLA